EADGAFVMIPFDVKAHDLHERENEMGMKLADAVRVSGVARVVLLSGTGAHLGRNAGSGMGAAMMEARLNDLGIAELVCLRGGSSWRTSSTWASWSRPRPVYSRQCSEAMSRRPWWRRETSAPERRRCSPKNRSMSRGCERYSAARLHDGGGDQDPRVHPSAIQ